MVQSSMECRKGPGKITSSTVWRGYWKNYFKISESPLWWTFKEFRSNTLTNGTVTATFNYYVEK